MGPEDGSNKRPYELRFSRYYIVIFDEKTCVWVAAPLVTSSFQNYSTPELAFSLKL